MSRNEFSVKSVWLLSPYHTGSHASWANGYKTHTQHKIDLLTMQGRFWKWRMQGGAMELAQQIRHRLQSGERPDLLLATDMVHVASLLGLLHPEIASGQLDVPLILYMHENQLTYPWRPGEKPDHTYAMINWTSQLCADQIFFNSHYHLESWFRELPNLLKHFPDYNHLKLVDRVREKCIVLPVGIASGRILKGIEQEKQTIATVSDTEIYTSTPIHTVDHAPTHAHEDAEQAAEVPSGIPAASHASHTLLQQTPPLVLWNQRWEYDKRPDLFFALLYRLDEANVPFRLAVAGENFRQVPQEFNEAQERLSKQIVHWGYLDSYQGYIGLMSRADLVVSTAIHEFFGISILEAITAGIFPLLPNHLSYPELIPPELHPACLYQDDDDLFHKAKQRLLAPRPAPPSLQVHVQKHFAWPQVAKAYDQAILHTIRQPSSANKS
ncbi:MAG: DUF3524 domain-containing protein [Chloroflexota bacterium]